MSENIHQRIKRLREAKGWTRVELGRRIAAAEGHPKTPISYQTVQQWEAETSAPKRKRLEFVAKVFGITASELAHGLPESPQSADLRELAECWPHLSSETRQRVIREARREAVDTLAKSSETYQKLMQSAAKDDRVAHKLGTPGKKKTQSVK